MEPQESATDAMVAALTTYSGDPRVGERARSLYRRWVAKALPSLTQLDDQSHAWLAELFPTSRTLPAMVLSTHRLLPGTTEDESLRAAYRPFELPFRLAEIHSAATRGSETAVQAMEQFDDSFQTIVDAARTVAPESTRVAEFVELTGSRQRLDAWTRPAVDVDLNAIRDQRRRAIRAVLEYGWRLDRQSHMAVLTFVRDVLALAPQLLPRLDELAAEGVRLALSGLAESVSTPLTPREALALAGGGKANPFPPGLADASTWRCLRLWKYRPSPLVLELEQGKDLEATDAVIRAGAHVVAETITIGPLDPRVRPVYGVIVRRWRQDLREELPLAERLVEFPPPVRNRILKPPAPPRGRADAPPGPQLSATVATEAAGADSAALAAPEADPVDAALASLDELVGLEAVKLQIRQVAALAKVNARRVELGVPRIPVGYHMLLTGNPGTGKTTVARMIGELFGAMGVLSKGHLVEAAPGDFIAQYHGGTEKKSKALIERAAGGVLFIDEAYNLTTDHPQDYGHDAIAVLVAEMENRRDDLVVLAAGYGHEMHRFLETNPGLRSRFSYTLPFPDLDDAALNSVFLGFTTRDGFLLGDEARSAVARAIKGLPRGPGFGNARDVRKLYEQSVVRQAARVLDGGPDALLTMLSEDIPGGEPPSRSSLESVGAELDGLVGLEDVKAEIRTLANLARLTRLRRDRGLPVQDEPVGHMVFTGNPGTGKTTVARLMGRMLHTVGALPGSEVLAVTRGDLVGEYLGQTAPKTRKAFERALGGVLFVDEAYSLVGNSHWDQYGQEALATLLPLMEEHRKHIVVVLAGYTEEMGHLLDANPGLRSRITRTIEFPDYSPEEMAQIVKARVQEREMTLSTEAQEALDDLMRRMPRDRTFGNARTAMAVLGEILERQANRLARTPTNRITRQLDRLEAVDVPEPVGGGHQRIGFV